MEHNDREREHDEMTEREFLAIMKAIRLLAEKAESTEEFLKEFDDITGIKKEPTSCTK